LRWHAHMRNQRAPAPKSGWLQTNANGPLTRDSTSIDRRGELDLVCINQKTEECCTPLRESALSDKCHASIPACHWNCKMLLILGRKTHVHTAVGSQCRLVRIHPPGTSLARNVNWPKLAHTQAVSSFYLAAPCVSHTMSEQWCLLWLYCCATCETSGTRTVVSQAAQIVPTSLLFQAVEGLQTQSQCYPLVYSEAGCVLGARTCGVPPVLGLARARNSR
jgi:hypothetical protein